MLEQSSRLGSTMRVTRRGECMFATFPVVQQHRELCCTTLPPNHLMSQIVNLKHDVTASVYTTACYGKTTVIILLG